MEQEKGVSVYKKICLLYLILSVCLSRQETFGSLSLNDIIVCFIESSAVYARYKYLDEVVWDRIFFEVSAKN